VDRDGHHSFAQEQADSLSSKREISEVFGVLEDNEGKWPQPELPGANNLEEAVHHMDKGSDSSRLHCAGSVGVTGSSKTLPLPPTEPDDLPTTRNKARQARSDLSSGEDSGDSEKNGTTGGSSSSGHGSDGGGAARQARPRLRSKLLLPLPGPSTAPKSSTVGSGEPEIPSGAGDGES